MVYRFFAVRVTSERGSNIYRLVGLAKPEDKTHSPKVGHWPDYLILTGNETNWNPIVTLSISPLSGKMFVDTNLSVEQ